VFERIYESPWHHPVACWVASAGVLIAALIHWKRSRFAPLAAFLAIEIALDAWLTGAWTPLARGSGNAALAAIVFVIFGDARWFYLIGRQLLPRTVAIAAAIMCAVVVPAASFAMQSVLKRYMTTPRHLFLLYELLFAGIAVLVWVWARRRVNAGPARDWIVKLCAFEVAQYLGWAIADVVIFTAGDVGFLVRVVPNLLYYAAFVPFAWATAPKDTRP
jgi:hypothetical protein